MIRRLTFSLLAALLVAGTLIAAGCGSSSKSDSSGGSGGTVQLDLKKVGEATKAKGSAELALSLDAKSPELKEPVAFAITGKVDFKGQKADLSTDLGPVLKASGAPLSGDGNIRILVDNKKLWIKMPALTGLTLPGGKSWVSLDEQQLQQQLGKKGQQPDTSTAGGGTLTMTKVGSEKMDGADVSHLKAEITMRELLDAVPGGQSQTTKDALAQAEQKSGADAKQALDTKVPVEVWIDGDNVLHKIAATIDVKGKQSGTVKFELTLKNFGTSVDVTPPPAGDVLDAGQLLQGLGASGLGKTS